ncbi:carboxylesterase [Paenibacillus sp. YYML68]|uniref:alpha/beta hydrolase n=1 Tax=Paenibacillus sp. YYML68 TaxID=2909250 RepID=UPI002491A2AA|nr:alpha/beta fold hydrolase [Paenibacillus sp. YYML68]
MTKCCLLLHGFTGSPFELEPLTEHLQRLGYSCRVPLLPGHDPQLNDLGRISWKDWLHAASEEAGQLAARYGAIDVVGFSMGGLLSAYVANRYPVRRLVMLSAAAIYVSPLRFLADLAERYRARDLDHLRRAKEVPLRAALQFINLAKYAKRQELNRVTQPTLIIQGARDPIVHPRSARYIYSKLRGEKELVYLPQSKHMICHDQEKADVCQKVGSYLLRA